MVALFVLLTFVIIITINLIVTKIRDKKISVFSEEPPPADSCAVFTKDSIYVPKDIYFNKNHVWASITDEGNLSLGFDDFINKIVQPNSIRMLIKTGERIHTNDNLFELRNGNKKITVKSPFTGIVHSINHPAINNFGAIKDDPYKDNWLIQMEPQKLGESLATLHIGKTVVEWMKNEIARFKEFLGAIHLTPSTVGATMYDGGNIAEGIFSSFDDEAIKKLEQDFLS